MRLKVVTESIQIGTNQCSYASMISLLLTRVTQEVLPSCPRRSVDNVLRTSSNEEKRERLLDRKSVV